MKDKRINMVENYLKPRGINDPLVLEAFESVPREEFVPDEYKEMAYTDSPLPIGHKATISQPYIVALMCQILELKKTDIVLDIGTGSGYEAAILAEICKKVVTVERVAPLAEKARETLKKLGYKNVEVITGDGSKGYPDKAPYDGIKVAAATKEAPSAWKKQIKVGGRIIFPQESSRGGSQTLVEIKRTEIGFDKKTHGGVRFVQLLSDSR